MIQNFFFLEIEPKRVTNSFRQAILNFQTINLTEIFFTFLFISDHFQALKKAVAISARITKHRRRFPEHGGSTKTFFCVILQELGMPRNDHN